MNDSRAALGLGYPIGRGLKLSVCTTTRHRGKSIQVFTVDATSSLRAVGRKRRVNDVPCAPRCETDGSDLLRSFIRYFPCTDRNDICRAWASSLETVTISTKSATMNEDNTPISKRLIGEKAGFSSINFVSWYLEEPTFKRLFSMMCCVIPVPLSTTLNSALYVFQ